MNDRFNTIAGWVLGGGIVLLGGTLVAGEIFGGHRPETMGYPIEGAEEEGKGGAQKAEAPIAALLATADAGRGEQTFKSKCTSCHTIAPGGPNQIGPNLHGILGQPIASRGFAYSDPLKSKGGTWTWEAMNDWIRSPRAFASGTKMTFAGIGDGQDRADLILFLNTQGSNLPMPAAPAASADPADASQAEARGNEASPATPAAPGAAPKQPVINEGQGAAPPRGGGEARPDSNLPGGGR
jgi:cytochrome c